eukprot:TRINITY_DN242019_c0_g1_i1.p1 TRINITY_DN242019_c0_g1~~TRINITY_DN242019_c0_g1_i1.p1  ORF type:complete len:323 (-),score=41.62 TRINITY_DN242019_c0_g1_i1:463-1431(-)
MYFCVLCGIPGVGKTCISNAIYELAVERKINVCVVETDFIERILAVENPKWTPLECWRSSRQSYCNIMQNLVENPSCPSNPHLISKYHWLPDVTDAILVIDDNMFYQSMRKEVLKVARASSNPVLFLPITCPLEIALSRNSTRSVKIPEHIVHRMSCRIEFPSISSQYGVMKVDSEEIGPLESATLILDNFRELSKVPDPVEKENLKFDSEQNEKSIRHQVDLLTRKMIPLCLNRMDSSLRKKAGKQVSKHRAKFLMRLKECEKGLIMIETSEDFELNNVYEKFRLHSEEFHDEKELIAETSSNLASIFNNELLQLVKELTK